MTAAAVLLLALALLAAMFAELAPAAAFVVAVAGALAAIGLAVADLATPRGREDDEQDDEDGEQPESDGERVEVHASTDPAFTPGPATLVAVLGHEPAAELLTHADATSTTALPVTDPRPARPVARPYLDEHSTGPIATVGPEPGRRRAERA